MPVSLAQITSNVATVKIPFGDTELTVTYYPNKVTGKYLSELQAAEDNDASINTFLSTVLKSWDLFEDDANTWMFPLDVSRLPELPLQLKSVVFWRVIGDLRNVPNLTTPKGQPAKTLS